MKNKKFNLKVFIICLLVVFVLLGGIGTLFTSNNTNTAWYSSIKPSITPANWVFQIAWNLLFLLISFSLYFAWVNSKNKEERKKVLLVFGINFLLNIFWSILFFGLKQPQIAFIEVIFFWFSILAMILVTRKITKKSSCLLVPYLVWVAFASVINYMAAFT